LTAGPSETRRPSRPTAAATASARGSPQPPAPRVVWRPARTARLADCTAGTKRPVCARARHSDHALRRDRAPLPPHRQLISRHAACEGQEAGRKRVAAHPLRGEEPIRPAGLLAPRLCLAGREREAALVRGPQRHMEVVLLAAVPAVRGRLAVRPVRVAVCELICRSCYFDMSKSRRSDRKRTQTQFIHSTEAARDEHSDAHVL
jgi:hypothetical protein